MKTLQQIREVSKDLLKRYLDKGVEDEFKLQSRAKRRLSVKVNNARNFIRDVPKNNVSDKSKADAEKLFNKAAKRRKYLNKAADKLGSVPRGRKLYDE